MTTHAPLSLHTRLLIAASVILVAFLGLTGAALDRAYRQSALALTEERLQAQIYGLLGAAELDADARLVFPDALPDPRFATPDSGLYARVMDTEGSTVWSSRSTLGTHLPAAQAGEPGQANFTSVSSRDGLRLFALEFPVRWELPDGTDAGYVLQVVEDRGGFESRVARYRRSLWGWLAGATVVLLAVQGAVTAWSLRPLRQVAREVAEVEAGVRERIENLYPRELQPLTGNLNGLIRVGRHQLERYRNTLADLAHSLKTPLAVLQGAADAESDLDELRSTLREQVERMDRTVAHQLRRAAASGHAALAPPIEVAPVAARLVRAIEKVHAERALEFKVEIPQACRFRIDQGDLAEIAGNLVDNAAKWARTRVYLRARVDPGPGSLLLEVEDDGPGIHPSQAALVTTRGVRGDTRAPGHGIGLAVVHDIVTGAYRGQFEIETGALGGALVRVRLAAGLEPRAVDDQRLR